MAKLETSIPEEQVEAWKQDERKWEDQVVRLTEEKDIKSPYEMATDKGDSAYV